MYLRSYAADDHDQVLALTIDTFGPFHEGIVRPLYGEVVFANLHGSWREDYRDQVAALHDPTHHKEAAVAEADGQIVGLVAWQADPDWRNGEVNLLAVRDGYRGRGLGTALCEHAFAGLRDLGAEVVTIGTGAADPFHASARALYRRLGCTRIDVAVFLREL